MENEVKKMDTSCWNGQICVDSSEWLADNIKGIDQSVKEMLQLVEHDQDSLLEKVDSNHPKQPELIARIKEISHRHHLLADHYNKLTCELISHSSLANETKSNQKTTFDPQLTPPFLTPMVKLRMHDVEGQVVGSDISLSSGGGISDITPNEGSDSSSLSSDSDSDTYKSPNELLSSVSSRKMMKHELDFDGYQMLLKRIADYEKELKVSNEKLLSAEEENAKLRSELQNNETVMVRLDSLEAELHSAKNQIKLHEAESEKENKESLMLQMKIVDLEDELDSEKTKVQELKESVKKHKELLSDRDLRIQKLNAELHDASGTFALEKWQLESSISKLSESLIFHEAKAKELEMQCELLTDENKKLEAEKVEMEKEQAALKISWQDDIDRVKIELSEKNTLVDILNENLDGLKLKHDVVMSEKDGIYAKIQTLSAEISCRDDRIKCLEQNLNDLHCENERLTAGSDSANKLRDELKSRIDELEKEVEMQEVMISDLAEGKREAIKQLCVSIDYFRCAYDELRNAYVVRKRPTMMVL